MVISSFSGKLFGCDYLKETTKNPKIPKDSINRRMVALSLFHIWQANAYTVVNCNW
jgi:hypothetical protein